jgi:hypothetical protein
MSHDNATSVQRHFHDRGETGCPRPCGLTPPTASFQGLWGGVTSSDATPMGGGGLTFGIGAAAVASFLAAVLTEIYPCGVWFLSRNIEAQRPRPGVPSGCREGSALPKLMARLANQTTRKRRWVQAADLRPSVVYAKRGLLA